MSASAARDAGRILGLSQRTIYGLLRLWQRSGGLVTSLAPEPSSGGRGKGRLTAAAEHLLTEAIRDEYLSKQKKRAEAVVRAVRDRCRAAGITPPAANTVRARVRRVRADKAARFREGSGSAAALRLTPAAGETPPAAHPMAVLQVDHTLVDLILVDETWRKPIGRPWLSVAIDTYSRCVAGLHLSYEAPSATVAGLCIAHAAQDKAVYLRGLNIKADWPCQGRPGEVFVDNGSEFHATAFERGCQQHAIALRFRPPGAPHWGGIVERLVGTTMTIVHELPGTTFSNPAQRGEYDSDATACLTLAELERWLVLAITGSYHNAVHGGLDEPPLARWKNGVAAHGAPSALSDPHAFMVDFLPVLRRRITREGIVVDHIAYFSDALRPLVAARDRLAQVLVRRDPRDLSWADRLAAAYDLDRYEFLRAMLGADPPPDTADLDGGLRPDLVATFSDRTGLPSERVRAMTLAGYTPALIDSVVPAAGLFEAYACRFGWFMLVARRAAARPESSEPWVPWRADDLLDVSPRCCRRCLAEDAIPYVRLHWRLAWMACCPQHGGMLVPSYFWPSLRHLFYEREADRADPDLLALDRITLSAVTVGKGVLPVSGDVVPGRAWLRALRTLIDELVRRSPPSGAGHGMRWRQHGRAPVPALMPGKA